TDRIEKALEIFTEHHFYALPIIDDQKQLLGYLDIQTAVGDAINLPSVDLRSEAFQLVGLHLEATRSQSIVKSYVMRMHWLFCNMFCCFSCTFISDIYSLTLSKFLVLTMFIPHVLSLSESVSMQTVMQVLLLIKKEGISFKRDIKMYIKEIQVVALV